MGRTLLVWVFIGAACSGGDAATVDAQVIREPPRIDAPTADAGLASLTCTQVIVLVESLITALDESCNLMSDCTTIITNSDWCDAHPRIVEVLSKTAASDAYLQAAVTEFTTRCAPQGCGVVTCVADQAPPHFDCVAKKCTHTGDESCFPAPDAGP